MLNCGTAKRVLYNVLTYCTAALKFRHWKIKTAHFSEAPPDVEGNAEEATVVDLFPWTEYEFRVIATNTLGTGDPSSPSPKVTTLEAGKITAHHDTHRLYSALRKG